MLQGHDIGFAYGVEGFVFHGVDFAARRVRWWRSSAERRRKATLVKVLAACSTGPRPPDRAGRDMRDWDKPPPAAISVVMQDDHLFVGTIEDDISLTRGMTPRRVLARPAGDRRSGGRHDADPD